MRNDVKLIAVPGSLEVGCGGSTLDPTDESRAKNLYRVAFRFQRGTNHASRQGA